MPNGRSHGDGRRLQVRSERHADLLLGFLHLACVCAYRRTSATTA
jgi:hypothetical protein